MTAKVVPFRQTKPYGCGLYAMANIFNNSSFLSSIIPEVGMDTFDINEALVLHEKESDLYLCTLVNVGIVPKAPRYVTDPVFLKADYNAQSESIRNDKVLIYCMSIDTGKKHHYIVIIHNFKHKVFHIIDSCKPTIETFHSPEEVLSTFKVTAIDHFHVRHIHYREEMNNKDLIVLFPRTSVFHLIPDEYR